MYAVHPKVGVRPCIDFPIKMQVPAVLPSVRIKLAAEPSISEMSFSASLITPFGQERLSE